MKTRVVALIAAVCAFLICAADDPGVSVQLWEYRNLGKAFYENPDTHQQAAEQLHKALQIAPDSVRERINYGLGLLRAGQTDAGVAELVRAQKQDSSLPHTWFNLGIAYKHAGDYDKAIEQFRGMLKLTPDEPMAHYNLATSLRSKNDSTAALPEFLEAERLNSDLAGPHFQLFTLYQRAGDKAAATRERQLFEEAKKKNSSAAVAEDMEWCFYAELYDPAEPRPSAESEATQYKEQVLSQGWESTRAHMQLVDTKGNGQADLLLWSGNRVELWKQGASQAKDTGLEGLKDVKDIAPGDFDNDGWMDLCVVTGSGTVLYHNNHGVFVKQSELSPIAGMNKGLAIDYDHDNDLDLLLFGSRTVLLRNNGDGKFEDKTDSFPAVQGGNALDATIIALRGDTAARDLVVSYADRVGVLYTDQLNGKFVASDLPLLSAGSTNLDAQDYDHDGLIDIVAYQPKTYAIRNHEGKLEAAQNAKPATARVRADFNGDQREDEVRFMPDGTVHLFLNASNQHWLSVRLSGVKNLKAATNATVEVKSGPYYNKRVYQGVPLAFATNGKTKIDTVRITWPNGLIQNETQKKSGELLQIEEAQRLSGSCPMIFTWNGERFQFITDVLGVAPLGASSGDGHYFPVDHDEYVQIPGAALQARNGKYQVHITEELHEISYLDQVQLIALDHPADVPIYTNDKFKSPPYPQFRLFGTRSHVHPVHAKEGTGQDVTAQLAATDEKYPDGFPHNAAGVAGLHTLDLDFGKAAETNRAVLVLNGWVDWADGSTFLGASQKGSGGLVFPYLQVKNKAGNWQTVVSDMGIPSGKPKTIAVDLTGKFLSPSREVRIVTNLCVYWDEALLLEDSQKPPVRLTPLNADAADLQFRGFSQAVIDPFRQQPEKFLYQQVKPVSNWNPTAGLYTRYGDVKTLVNLVDDKLLIMGSGDEVKLEFSASALPPLPQGWARDFLLFVDGWAKDADANTAFSQSVAPLPFHAMSAYPYKPNERFPDSDEYKQYRNQYLTRPALRLIRPLTEGQKTTE